MTDATWVSSFRQMDDATPEEIERIFAQADGAGLDPLGRRRARAVPPQPRRTRSAWPSSSRPTPPGRVSAAVATGVASDIGLALAAWAAVEDDAPVWSAPV